MSPLAAVLAQTLSPGVIVVSLLTEWWAIWFTLGRNFSVTTLMTLSANGLSLLLAAALVYCGVLGDPAEPVAPAGLPVLAAAAAAALCLVIAVEAMVLRRLMRQLRPGWSWNGYDLLTFSAANAVGMLVATWLARGA
ncbi:MAG: hypothetical protein ISR76_03795 [Planctomycetes bacterium]|nr:hypothetical protein [Planctomycetota bacterium]MBL7008095.1 hypothetical protein [Planctomycetota bacterium]